jgi:hypothetical protein
VVFGRILLDDRNKNIFWLIFVNLRSGLFTPDEAFEYIVQIQIAKFEEPIMKCVDMVVSELLSIIHETTSKVSLIFLL